MKKIKIFLLLLVIAGTLTISFAIISKPNTQLDVRNISKDNLIYISTSTPESSFPNDETTIEIYIDKNNNEFIYNKQGIAGYRLHSNEEEYKTRSLYQKSLDIKKISDDYLKDIVNIEEYVMEPIKYITSEEAYDITYYKYIQNIKTADFISLFINKNGKIVSYMAPNIDIFKNINVPSIYANNINQIIYNRLTSIYGNLLISYDISDKYLILNNDKIILRCYLDITLNNSITSNIQDIEIN